MSVESRKKRVFLIGASGIIGKAIDKLLDRERYDVITGGFSSGDIRLDLSKPETIISALKEATEAGRLDHIISAAGRAEFVPLEEVEVAELEDSKYGLGILDKLMGQVNLTLAARDYLTDGGSVVLTTGTTSDEPILGGSSLSMVNGAVEKWAMAAATELPRNLRVNVVSPSLAIGTPEPGFSAFPGFKPIPAEEMALAYIRCIESGITGRTLKI